MFAKGPEDSRTHYVHLVRLGDSNWDRWLTFRDYLRQNEAARRTYAREKNRLAVMHRANRDAYTAGKGRVIASLLLEARSV